MRAVASASVEYLPGYHALFQRYGLTTRILVTAHCDQNLVCIPEKGVKVPLDRLNQNGCSQELTALDVRGRSWQEWPPSWPGGARRG